MEKSDLSFIEKTAQNVLAGKEISFADAYRLMQVEGPDIYIICWPGPIRFGKSLKERQSIFAGLSMPNQVDA